MNVFLCAPGDVRAARIAERLGVDLAEARRQVHAVDSARTAYVRQVHGQDWREPVHYPLVVNTGLVDYDQALELILRVAARVSTPTGSNGRVGAAGRPQQSVGTAPSR